MKWQFAKRDSFENDVAFVISNLAGGGSQRVLTVLANYWNKQGRRVCVITHADREEDFFHLSPSVRRMAVQGPTYSRSVITALAANIRRIAAIRRALKEADAGVVLSFVASTNILVVLASVGLPFRIVISERNDPRQQPLGWMWHRLRRLVYSWADVVTANSQGALYGMKSYVPAHKLALVPNPITPPLEKRREKKTSSIILNVGNLTAQKAHDVLLEAFARLSSRFPEWRLAIVGDGKLGKALRRQAQSLGISDKVDWYGRVRDIDEYYAEADLFVLPSRYEGMPNALLEAMSYGLPAIVSDASPGPLEHVKDGVTGLVTAVDNVPSLAATMERLIKDPALRLRLGAAAARQVAKFSLKGAIGDWEEILRLPAR